MDRVIFNSQDISLIPATHSQLPMQTENHRKKYFRQDHTNPLRMQQQPDPFDHTVENLQGPEGYRFQC